MTKDSGGWTPLVFASRSGSRRVFVAAMQAFIDRGEEGSRRVSSWDQIVAGVQVESVVVIRVQIAEESRWRISLAELV